MRILNYWKVKVMDKMKNTKLYYRISQEINEAQSEFDIANSNYKQNKSVDNDTIKKVAECKLKQWQKAMNLLYIEG